MIASAPLGSRQDAARARSTTFPHAYSITTLIQNALQWYGPILKIYGATSWPRSQNKSDNCSALDPWAGCDAAACCHAEARTRKPSEVPCLQFHGPKMIHPGNASGANHGGERSAARSRLTRRYEDDSDWENDGDGPDDVDNGGNKSAATPKTNFACPFYKFDPTRHLQLCQNLPLKSYKDVKNHLINRHKCPEFYCPTCWRCWEADDLERCLSHIRERRCAEEPELEPEPEFLLPQELHSLMNLDVGRLSDEKKWYRMWELLFVGHQAPSSPYIDRDKGEIRDARLANADAALAALPGQLSAAGVQLDDEREKIQTAACNTATINAAINATPGAAINATPGAAVNVAIGAGANATIELRPCLSSADTVGPMSPVPDRISAGADIEFTEFEGFMDWFDADFGLNLEMPFATHNDIVQSAVELRPVPVEDQIFPKLPATVTVPPSEHTGTNTGNDRLLSISKYPSTAIQVCRGLASQTRKTNINSPGSNEENRDGLDSPRYRQKSPPPGLFYRRRGLVITSLFAIAALTVREYLSQTWPAVADTILQLLPVMLDPCLVPAYTRRVVQGTSVKILYEEDYALMRVAGHSRVVIQILQAFTWIASAARAGPGIKGVWDCIPIFSQCKPEKTLTRAKTFVVHFFPRPIPVTTQPGRCWQHMFQGAVIARGFPIPQRVANGLGLEMPLNMMAELGGSQKVTEWNDAIFIKGYSTMLVAIKTIGDILVWHYYYSRSGSRVSYMDCAVDAERVNGAMLERYRHVIGWCSRAKYCAGSADAKYDIELPPHLSRNGRIPKLKWLSRRYFIFWDEEVKAGWLVNGTSALLHIVRASLSNDEKSTLRSCLMFDKTKITDDFAHDSYKHDTAMRVLIDPGNQGLPVYLDSITHRQDTILGSSSSTSTQTANYFLFGDLVMQHLSALEQIIDFHTHVAGRDGINLKPRFRKHLEGWDFADLAREDDPQPRIAEIPTIGHGWVDFVRSIGAVALAGDGAACHRSSTCWPPASRISRQS
ncbi:hypothetical protein NLG97_g9629 [Lecanicillium saksenae]|uniref:Uncharacterized protein n=1 Tax=Lecanicillium saksenae TaxID=468837 RepID=A0ACC1QIS0_9HYPO|nr:hypothetical protein NLG97_g9629 [Lecanicillium saksenae]